MSCFVCGDLFHKPESIDQDLAIFVAEQFDRLESNYPKFKMIYIDGNHDLKSVNRIDRITKGWPFVFHKNFMSCVNLTRINGVLMEITTFMEFPILIIMWV